MTRREDSALKISVVMPAYSAAHYLVRSLPPLIELRDQGLVDEVIVVDDCSPDGTTAHTARAFGATVIQAEKNGGPGAARNLAAELVTNDLLWFVDADVVVHPDAVARIPETFSDPDVHALFGSYDDNPPADGFASQYKNLTHRFYHIRSDSDASTFWSGCGVVRREEFVAVNGFDIEQFKRPSIEDIELGYRLRDAGGKIVLDRNFLCTHLKEWSLTEVVMTDVTKRAAPWSKLLARRSTSEKNLNLSWPERFRAVIAAIWLMSVLTLPRGIFWPTRYLNDPQIFVLMSGIVIAANWDFLVYFVKRRGLLFGLASVAFHQVYYVYSATTFVLVTFWSKLKSLIILGT